jgi:hypothetical protein
VGGGGGGNNGTIIIAGGLEIVHVVENYKEYNVVKKEEGKPGSKCNCACTIF